MTRFMRLVGQAAAYALFAGCIGYFSVSPRYTHRQPDQAEIKLSFSHAGQLKEECRQLSADELAQLAPNMRTPEICPRERSPVQVELELDGRVLVHASLQPSGLANDGVSTIYRRLPVPAGQHTLAVRLNDNVRQPGYHYVQTRRISLRPGRILVIDFDADAGGFRFY